MKTLEELLKMAETDSGREEIRVLLAGLLGVKPELVEWWAHKDDETRGSVCMRAETEREILLWLERLPEGSWAKEYKPKPFYRYPDYTGDLNECHRVEMRLTIDQSTAYVNRLWPQGYAPFQAVSATALQRSIALILTLQST